MDLLIYMAVLTERFNQWQKEPASRFDAGLFHLISIARGLHHRSPFCKCVLWTWQIIRSVRNQGVAWVWNHDDGNCFQKYDTGEFSVTRLVDSRTDAGILVTTTSSTVSISSTSTTSSRTADEMCAFVANSNIGWTGSENVVGQLGLYLSIIYPTSFSVFCWLLLSSIFFLQRVTYIYIYTHIYKYDMPYVKKLGFHVLPMAWFHHVQLPFFLTDSKRISANYP